MIYDRNCEKPCRSRLACCFAWCCFTALDNILLNFLCAIKNKHIISYFPRKIYVWYILMGLLPHLKRLVFYAYAHNIVHIYFDMLSYL